MSSKENAAMFQLFDLLESRYAMRTLWVLRDHRPQTFRLLQDSLGGVTPNTLNTRLKALREAGIAPEHAEAHATAAREFITTLTIAPMRMTWTLITGLGRAPVRVAASSS